jgi:apolipoprotein N-acyltransferase
MRASNWIQQADQAMIRAAARARAVAASTNTTIHIMRDGKIVEIFPAKEVRYPTSDKFHEEPKLSVVREDTPPYGSRKL